MIPDLDVALIQDEISWQNPAASRDRYDRCFEALKSTDLVVLPEMFSTGFYMEPWQCFETMEGETVAWMRDRARGLGAVVTGSLIMKTGEDFVNRMIWARPDGELTWYDKRHLFRFGGEHHHYLAGDQRVVVTLNGWRLLLLVCYDLRFPVWSRNRNDYDAIICVANWPNARQFAWDMLLIARAIENQAFMLGVNRTGANPLGDAYSGGSAILDFKGQPLASAGTRNTLLQEALSMQPLDEFREYFPAAMDGDDFQLN